MKTIYEKMKELANYTEKIIKNMNKSASVGRCPVTAGICALYIRKSKNEREYLYIDQDYSSKDKLTVRYSNEQNIGDFTLNNTFYILKDASVNNVKKVIETFIGEIKEGK